MNNIQLDDNVNYNYPEPPPINNDPVLVPNNHDNESFSNYTVPNNNNPINIQPNNNLRLNSNPMLPPPPPNVIQPPQINADVFGRLEHIDEIQPRQLQPRQLQPTVNQPVIRQLSIIEGNNNARRAEPERAWIWKFNSFLKKKNFTCIYFALMEILFLVIVGYAYSNNDKWEYLMLPPTIDIAVNFIYILYIAKEKSHCCKDKLCWHWFTNLSKIPIAIFSWKAASAAKDDTGETFVFLIPMMIFVGIISMCNMEEENVDGRGGPMYFYENFDYLLIYTQMIVLSSVLSNIMDTFNWGNILIPLFILSCLKSLKTFVITLNWLCSICEINRICKENALKKREL